MAAVEAMEHELPLLSDEPLEDVVDTDVLRRFPRVCVFVIEKDAGSCMMNCRGGRVSSFCSLDGEVLLEIGDRQIRQVTPRFGRHVHW